jgi:spore coat protein U-like protein
MVSGSNYMSYDIYKEATGNRWGGSGTNAGPARRRPRSVPTVLRTYNYTAKVLTNQATPPAGTYTDTLIVDVAF